MKRTFAGDIWSLFSDNKPGSGQKELQGNDPQRWSFAQGPTPDNHKSGKGNLSVDILQEGLHQGLHVSQVSFCPPEHKQK